MTDQAAPFVPRTPISAEINGLAAVTGGNPMRRDDYRQPLRRRMLADAKRHLLESLGCPPLHSTTLCERPMVEVSARIAKVAANRAAATN